MNNNESITALSIGGETFNIDNVAKYLEKTNAAIKAIKGVEENDELTNNKSLPPFGALIDINDTSILIQVYSMVTGKEKAYKEAAKEMKINKIPIFKINGITANKWKKAIIKREIVASSAAKLAQLEKVKKLMTDMLSKEEKAKAKLKELSEVLSKL